MIKNSDIQSHMASDAIADLSRLSRIQENLWLRARILEEIRRFFIKKDYLEVETPCRIPAPAPELHIDAQEAGDWYLQTSPELCMKRLLAAGYNKLFQLCRCFRKGERGRKHLPEFTLLEWYRTGSCYFDLMKDCEALIRSVARHLGRRETLLYQKKPIDLSLPWNRLTVAEAFDRFSSISLDQALADERFDHVMAFEIEPHLGLQKPLFLYDYPESQAALAQLKPKNSKIAQRFELYIAGLELCNGFTELIDPAEQRNRFENECCGRKKRGQRVYPLPEIFLNTLSHMPEAAGNALGIDRLVMLFADTGCIDDVVAFPTEMV